MPAAGRFWRSAARVWYISRMSSNARHTAPRTAMMPVTTMEEVQIPSDEERAEMLASLKAAEARIAAGDYVVHNPETFVDEMMAIRAAALAKKA